MKREILFKAKRVNNGEWVEGFLFCPNAIIPHSATYNQTSLGVLVHGIVEVHPETVCQFTGIFNGENKNVFEGDWLENPKGERGYVVFRDGAYWLRTKKKGFDDLYMRIDSGFLKNKKIIGSIHDK